MAVRMFKAVVVSYADRVAALVLPLLMLRGIAGPEVYVRIEYVISVSVLVATFCDGGLRNYVLYHFGKERDAGQTTRLTGRACLLVLLGQMLLLGVVALVAWALLPSPSPHGDLALGVLRGIALSLIGLAMQLLILHQRPLAGFGLSLSSWLIGGVALALPAGVSGDLRVTVFFAAAFLVVLAVPVLLWRSGNLRLDPEGRAFFAAALHWGWPLLLAAAGSIMVAQVARIYGFAQFELAAAVAFAFWMRILSIIQLSHRAAVVMVSREVFVAEAGMLPPKAWQAYLRIMLPTILLGLAAVLLAPILTPLLGIPVPQLPLPVAGFMILHIALWCFSALLELPFTRAGRLKVILVAALLPATLFLVVLLLVPDMDLLRTMAAMAVASCLQFLVLLSQRRKLT